jgi:hypothetical protein
MAASAAPLFASLGFSLAVLLGGASLKKRIK